MSDDLLLGVYGGGSGTQAVVARIDGTVIGRGLGPPCDHHTVGLAEACQALKTAITGAFGSMKTTSWTEAGLGAACFGLAGIDSADDVALFTRWLKEERVLFPVSIINDSEVILNGGTPEGWGVALISATGSICVGRTAAGASARVGGWGHILVDQGSGYEIARMGLSLATRTADKRGDDTALLQAALAHWGLKRPEELMVFVYRPQTTADDIASFAARVLELASRNASARRIVDQAAADLAAQFDCVAHTLGLDRPPLALGGTTMRVVLKKAVLDHLGPRVGPVSLVTEPVLGAVAAARRLLDRPHKV